MKLEPTKLSLDCDLDAGTNSISCGSEFVNGPFTVGKASPAISTGINKLQLYGTDTSSAGPHVQAFTTTDTYPVSQFFNWTHDNVAINFDAYFDGTLWKSSDVGSNYQIYKLNDRLLINCASGFNSGDTITGFFQ